MNAHHVPQNTQKYGNYKYKKKFQLLQIAALTFNGMPIVSLKIMKIYKIQKFTKYTKYKYRKVNFAPNCDLYFNGMRIVSLKMHNELTNYTN